MQLICTERDVARRSGRLGNLLSQISNVMPVVIPKSRISEFVLAARFGGQITENEREWLFPSTVAEVDCSYLERWLPIDAAQSRWRLGQAYFHLMLSYDPDKDPREILAFHWEPLQASVMGDGNYSRRPHFHWSFSPAPIRRTHLVATLTVPPEDQANEEYLDKLLAEVVRLVRTEVLDRLDGSDVIGIVRASNRAGGVLSQVDSRSIKCCYCAVPKGRRVVQSELIYLTADFRRPRSEVRA